MDKKIAGLIGAVSALVAISSAQAATPNTPALAPAESYADLLKPIPNAVALLATSDAALANSPAEKNVQVADHHHHHHHRYHRRHHHHHHHHYDRG